MYHLGWWFSFSTSMCVCVCGICTHFPRLLKSLSVYHCKHRNVCDRYTRFFSSFYFVFLYVRLITWCVKRHVSFLWSYDLYTASDDIKAFVDSFRGLLNCHRGLIRPEPSTVVDWKNDTYTESYRENWQDMYYRYYYLCCVPREMMNQLTEENKVHLKWT